GASVLEAAGGQKIVVVNVMCRLFMDAIDDPFRTIDAELAKYALGRSASCILVDVHGEATSEKQSMGHHCDGRVSAVLGTHSHIPAADIGMLPGRPADQTGGGVCGECDAVEGRERGRAGPRLLDT